MRLRKPVIRQFSNLSGSFGSKMIQALGVHYWALMLRDGREAHR